MRVLHVSPTYYSSDSVVGGGEKYISYVSASLLHASSSANQRISISEFAVSSESYEFVDSGGVRQVRVPGTPWEPKSIDLVAFQIELDNSDVILIHQALSEFGLFFASHARLRNKIVIGFDHGGGEHPLVHQSTQIGVIFDFLVAQSDYSASFFHDLDVPIYKIYGPVDTARFQNIQAQNRNENLVLSIGRILKHKGFDTLIDALPDHMSLVIAGTKSDQIYYDYLLKLIDDSKKDITIKEGLSDSQILELMSMTGTYVHPSVHEAFDGTKFAKPELLGLAPLEALASGVLTFVSEAGALPELSKNVGCHTFQNKDGLHGLLEASNELRRKVSTVDIKESTEKNYGHKQFGYRLLEVISNLRVT